MTLLLFMLLNSYLLTYFLVEVPLACIRDSGSYKTDRRDVLHSEPYCSEGGH